MRPVVDVIADFKEEVAALRELLDKAEKALMPFARASTSYAREYSSDVITWDDNFTVGDLRKAEHTTLLIMNERLQSEKLKAI